MLDGGPTAPMRAAAAEPLLTDRPSGDESAGACCPCSGSRADSTGSPHNQLVTSPSRGDWSGRAHRKLGVCSVMMVVFFNVSGGPLGSEEVVRYGGPLIGLSSLVAFAAVYSVPQAMLTAELSTAFPDNGGYSLWAKAAFGDFWGVQQSYWSWFAGVTDSALYPVLLVSSAEQLFNSFGKHDELRSECHAHQHHAAINLSLAAEPRLFGTSSAHAPPSAPGLPPKPDDSNLWGCMFEESGSHECAAKLGVRLLVLGLFTLPNILSSKLVGHAMVGVGVFTILPFLVLSAWGVANGDFDAERLLQRPPGGVRWGSMLSVVFWSLEGFDNASTFAGEVNDPGRTYPRALGLAVALMLFTYLLPLGVGAAADPEWSCWKDGSLAYVARLIGGPVLGGWVLVSALVSNWGLFSAELLGDSYQLLGMAHVGLAPRVFGRRSRRFGTPLNAIMLQLFINAMLVGLDFDAIMCIDNFFCATSVTLEFAAGVQLRRTHARLHRPYKMPFGTLGLAAFIAPAIGINVYIMVITASASLTSATLIAAASVVGLLLWLPFQIGWMDTAQLSRMPSEYGESNADGEVCRMPSADVALFRDSHPGPDATLKLPGSAGDNDAAAAADDAAQQHAVRGIPIPAHMQGRGSPVGAGPSPYQSPYNESPR